MPPRTTIRLLIQHGNGKDNEYSYDIPHEEELTEKGEEAFASELFGYARAELAWPQYRRALRPVADLPASSPHVLQEPSPAALFDVMNRPKLWLEIQYTLYDITYNLARAKAYKDIEPEGPVEQWYPAHSHKLAHLNIAAVGLAKIQDLVVRLLFESFGGTDFIPVNTSEEDWEKALTMTKTRKALERLRAEDKLGPLDFDRITEALEDPARSKHHKTVVRYRNCVAHRVRPSVDHREMGPVLQNREGEQIFDKNGKHVGKTWTIGTQPSKPDFNFMTLFEAMKDYLIHLNIMLTGLKSIPRLS